MRRLLALLTLGLVVAGTAAADDGPLISADTSRLGRIDLYLADVEGTQGTFYELVGEERERIGAITVDQPTAVHIADALTWSCTRRTRRLVADVVHPDGTTASASYVTRTPGCQDRLGLEAPRSARPGSRVAVTVIDGWALGDVAPRLCVRSPNGKQACRAVRFAGRDRAVVHVALTRDGTWSLDLALAGAHVRRTLTAGFANSSGQQQERPVLLVTGDSTVQNIDAAIGDRLRRSVRLVRDFKPGSAISRATDDWMTFAARQTRSFNPRLTVISIGGSDGYPMRTPDGATTHCCTDAWQAEYTRRAAAIMTTFRRAGHGHPIWLTLPAPEDPDRARISAAVNASVERAAAATEGVVLVRVDRVLTPGFRYRRAMRYHGARRVVRTPDGIHLTPAGAAIATDLIMRALSRLDWD